MTAVASSAPLSRGHRGNVAACLFAEILDKLPVVVSVELIAVSPDVHEGHIESVLGEVHELIEEGVYVSAVMCGRLPLEKILRKIKIVCRLCGSSVSHAADTADILYSVIDGNSAVGV